MNSYKLENTSSSEMRYRKVMLIGLGELFSRVPINMKSESHPELVFASEIYEIIKTPLLGNSATNAVSVYPYDYRSLNKTTTTTLPFYNSNKFPFKNFSSRISIFKPGNLALLSDNKPTSFSNIPFHVRE